MAVSQLITGLKQGAKPAQEVATPVEGTLPYAQFVDTVIEHAKRIADDVCHGKKLDKFMICYERPSEYRGPELSNSKNAAFYLYNSGRAEYNSEHSPGIIAVEVRREGQAMRVVVNSDRPEDQMHQKIVDQLNTNFPQAVLAKATISESIGRFFVQQVTRLAQEELGRARG